MNLKKFLKQKLTLTSGFTIAEVLICVGILCSLFTALILMSVQTAEMSSRTDYEYAAANLCKTRIEEAKMLIDNNGFDSLTDSKFGETQTRIDANGIGDASGDFRRTTTIVQTWGGNSRLTQVTVDIDYYFRGTLSGHVVSMSTVFSDVSVAGE